MATNQAWKSEANYNSATAGNAPAAYARKDGPRSRWSFCLARFTAANLKASWDWSTCFASRKPAGIGATANGRNFPETSPGVACSSCRRRIRTAGRCRFDSWVGEELDTNERVEMGTKPDGSNYQWPE